MIVRVATATHRSVPEVAAESFALTLWTHLHLAERDRTNGQMRTLERLNAAELGAVAFHEPKRLADVRRDLLLEARGVDGKAYAENVRQRALQFAKELEHVRWSEVSLPHAPTPRAG